MTCGHPGACAFEQVHAAWIAGDLGAFMELFDEDIVWQVNIDGIAVPYASSAVGKADLLWRLQYMLGLFEVERFKVIAFDHGADACRSSVEIRYVHKQTGEPMELRLRFTGWQGSGKAEGKLVRFQETADAAYVHAYERFVQFLQRSRQASTD